MISLLEQWPHRWVPAQGGPSAPTVLLLHGTGGDESDLLSLGAMLAPGAALLSPRGRVLEHGMPRYFRRIREGVFDEVDIRARTPELAEFVRSASAAYGFATSSLYALGYSNGANIAASLLLLEPGILRGGVLFRAVLPLEPDVRPALAGTHVLISAGRHDPMSAAPSTQRLADVLTASGADVALSWQSAGHELVPGDLEDAGTWFSTQFGSQSRKSP